MSLVKWDTHQKFIFMLISHGYTFFFLFLISYYILLQNWWPTNSIFSPDYSLKACRTLMWYMYVCCFWFLTLYLHLFMKTLPYIAFLYRTFDLFARKALLTLVFLYSYFNSSFLNFILFVSGTILRHMPKIIQHSSSWVTALHIFSCRLLWFLEQFSCHY